MDIIIGGAYQGKLDYARESFNLTDADIYECTESTEIDLSRRCIVHLERWILGCIRAGRDDYRRFDGAGKIIIADDIFCGVVPVDETVRLWREETGRTLTALCARADSVTRVFCGLARRLK